MGPPFTSKTEIGAKSVVSSSEFRFTSDLSRFGRQVRIAQERVPASDVHDISAF